MLVPGLRRLWRDRHNLQLGTDPGRAVVLELADPALARVLELLDGTRTDRGIARDAAALGVPEAATATLLDTLHQAGLAIRRHTLLPAGLPEPARRRLATEAAALAMRGRAPVSPAEAVRRRASARVVVGGYPRLAVPIAAVLAEAGIGHVDPALTGRVRADDVGLGALLPADSGRPRATAAAEAVARVAPTATVAPLRGGTASVVVQAGARRPAQLAALADARRGVAHLAVEIRDGIAVIGPLVPPAGSPCLNCYELHRRDRDPGWPAIVAQLATGAEAAPPCSVTTALAAVGYAAEEVLAYVDGGAPDAVGTTIEVLAPGRERRRRWAPHPRCGCGADLTRRRRGGAGTPARAALRSDEVQ